MSKTKLKLTGYQSLADAIIALRCAGFFSIHRGDGLYEFVHDDGRRFGLVRRGTPPSWSLSDRLPRDAVADRKVRRTTRAVAGDEG
jgi:hypothetical protein